MSLSGPVPEWTSFPVPLGKSVWPSVVAAIATTLKSHGVERLEVMHGWTQSALEDHPDFPALQWQSEDVVTSSVLGLVQERQEMGMRLGEDDLFLECEAPVPCQILLCHEGDLHLKTRDSGLVAALQAALFPLGVSLIRRSESVA